MKIEALHEAKLAGAQAVPYVTRLYNDLKKDKPDLTTDNFAWFVSYLEAQIDFDSKDLMYIFYEGYEGLKGNPTRMNEVLETFLEDDEDDSDDSYSTVLLDARKFFQIKP